MKKLQIFSLLICGYFLSNTCYAIAPVVDESENFAITSNAEPELQQPLAHDDGPNTSTANHNQIAQLLNQLQELQQSVQEMRGQIENQNHTIETLKNQQLTLYKDLDERLQTVKAPMTDNHPKPIPTINSNNTKNPAEEQVAYMAAYQFIDQHEFKKASLALQDFVKKYPQSAYTANAEYWLGEVLLQDKNFAAAMAHFENVVNNFPASNKHAASLYKLGVALAQNGQSEDARRRYLALIQQYPDTDTAKLAQNQLKRL